MILIAFLLFIGFISNAQLSSLYNYSYTGTNANVYLAAPMTTLQSNGNGGNNTVFASQGIGFTFKFNCVDYTTIGISGNGFVWFGSGTCTSTQYTPLSSTTGETATVAGIVSAFGANLTQNGLGYTNTLRTKTSGTAPNRVFTIEWRGVDVSAAANNTVDAQIKLYETSNNIEIRLYDNGYFLFGSDAIGEVGIRTTTADFLNRTTSGGNLCTTTAGATNTATCSIVAAFACDYAFSGSGAITFNYNYNGTCCTFPSTQPTALTASPISSIDATLNWTPGNGSGGDVVFLKQASAITTDPSNTTSYVANAVFGSGSQIGATGAFAVYSGVAGSTTISNLLPNTTYYYKIYTFNSGGPCYLTPTTLSGSFTTLSPPCTSPTIQPSLPTISCIDYTTMNLRFTRGNGNRAIVVARAVSNVNADPAYNTTYTANANFGSGSQIGIGNFVVYDGNDAGIVTVPLTGLSPSTTYYFKIYEYNSPTNCYNTLAPASINATTRGEGIYSASTTTQNTTNVSPGALAQDVVKLNIVISGGNDLAATLNNIVFTTAGSTNPTTDITNAKIFYTGSSNVFSNTTQYGGTFTSFVGALTATANFALLAGNNYFWIAYDVKSTATGGNVLDVTVTSFNITDGNGTANFSPTPTAPVGIRLIATPVPLVYCSGVIPLAIANGSGCNYSCSQGENLTSISITGATVLSFSGWPCNGDCANSQRSYNDMFLINQYSMLQGSTNPMSINFSTWFSGQMNWVLWVDWGQDGVFTNASPERFPATGSIDQWTSQNIVVPASVSSGRHRARLWMQESSATISTPCNTAPGPFTTSLGQIVDFDIEVPDGSLVNLDPAVASGGVSCATFAPTITTPINYTLGDAASPLLATGTGLLWYTSPTGGVGLSTAPTPSTSSSGTTTYYVSQTNTSGSPLCEGPRIQIAVNIIPPPLPTAPIVSVIQPTCTVSTGSVLLSGLPAAGSWTINPDAIIGSGTTNTISPVIPGTYSYTVTNAYGCISPPSANAVVNTQPPTPAAPIIGTVTQPTVILPTGSVDLSGLPIDTWTVNPGTIAGAATVTTTTVSGLAPGTYTFTVTNVFGCTSVGSASVVISAVLPIELLSFSGECDDRLLVLNWATASENKNDFFTVEKSLDLVNWDLVGEIKGAGYSTSLLNYSFADKTPFIEMSYYRLKQTDFDGVFNYSEIIYFDNCKDDNLDIIVSPNPSNGLFNILFDGDVRQITCIDVCNVLGEKIFNSNGYKSTIDLGDMKNGIYFIKITLNSKMITQKIIIEK